LAFLIFTEEEDRPLAFLFFTEEEDPPLAFLFFTEEASVTSSIFRATLDSG
jgi:hypothetical protein